MATAANSRILIVLFICIALRPSNVDAAAGRVQLQRSSLLLALDVYPIFDSADRLSVAVSGHGRSRRASFGSPLGAHD